MRADIIRTATRGPLYEPHEDTLIIRMVAGERTPADIAAAIGRSESSVEGRIYILRRSGAISGYSPRRRTLEVEKSISLKPPLELRNDDELVARTRWMGGFPTAVVTSVGTIWANGDGLPWRYGRPLMGDPA